MPSTATYSELAHRLEHIVGVPFEELGELLDSKWKGDATHNKGWAGQLVHRLVGDDSKGAPAPDIQRLGLEVKTIPVGPKAKVLQPTKVGTLNFTKVHDEEWYESETFHKLRSVLFVPIVKLDPKSPEGWFIRRPFLWLPSVADLEQFKQDYDSVRELVRAGRPEDVSGANPPAGQGKHLHARPDAPSSKTRRAYRLGDKKVALPPRAWMLRESFTGPLVQTNLRIELRALRLDEPLPS